MAYDIMNPLSQPTNVGGGPPPPAPGVTPTQTGQPDMITQWNNWLTGPGSEGNRAMLGQMGAMLLQPTAPGQTLAGKVGQAFAGGAAAKSRNQDAAFKRQQAQQQQQNQQQQTAISQQNADTSRMSAENSSTFNKGYLASLGNTQKDADNIQTFMLNLAKQDATYDPLMRPDGTTPSDLMADPAWQAKAASAWQANRNAAAGAPPLSSTIPTSKGVVAQPPMSGGGGVMSPTTQYKDGDVYTYANGVKAKLVKGVWRKL